MNAPSPTRFKFDTVFSAAGDVDDPRAHVLDQARAEAFAEGETAGRQAALDGIERALAETMTAICAGLETLDDAHRAGLETIRDDAARLAHLIASKLAPVLIRRAPVEEILALAGECLTRMPTEPRIVLRVEESLVEATRARIDEVATGAGFSGAVILLGDPMLGPGECRVEWPDGGAERDPRALAGEIEEIIEHHCRSWNLDAGPTGHAAPSNDGSW